MKTMDARHYDIIVAPVVTEKATVRLRAQQGCVQGCLQRRPSRRSRTRVEKLFDVKVKSVNTLVRKGKTKVFRGQFGSQSDT